MTVKENLEYKIMLVNTLYLKTIMRLKLDLNEFLLLLFFINENKSFDVNRITNVIQMSESEVLKAFNSLIKKKLINVETKKNSKGKIEEAINLNYFYSEIEEDLKFQKKYEDSENIYSIFEKEFARPISSMEYEIIKAWLEKEFSQELILGALKEAVYNGVTNLRYIDKILYEWQKKGFKSMKDVNDHMKKRNKENDSKKELFDYNWLDDENN